MESNTKIKFAVDIDIEPALKAVEGSNNLEDEDKLFGALASIQEAKNALKAAQTQVDYAEANVKACINQKAKELLGDDWAAIKGTGYKITRSGSGSVFEVTGKADEAYTIVKVSADTKAVETYIKETGKLPKGIEYNPNRGEQIRITLHENS